MMRIRHNRAARIACTCVAATTAITSIALADQLAAGQRHHGTQHAVRGGSVAGGPNCGDGTLTQSIAADVIEGEASIVCDAGTASAETSLARSFIAESSITIECVTFGIDVNKGAVWPVHVRVLAGAVDGPYDNLLVLAESAVLIPAGAASTFHVAEFPGGVAIPAASQFIVELTTPTRAPAAGGDGGFIALGCNDNGQTAPTYIRAVSCGVPNFIPTNLLGFPNSQVVMTVSTFSGGGVSCNARLPSCFEPHAGPGCNDVTCCANVCAVDALCCAIAWDLTCVTSALALCIGCSADYNGAIAENEPCGVDVNNGCHGTGNYGFLSCVKPTCGELSVDNNGATFDVDWYTLDLSSYSTVVRISLSLVSEIPAAMYVTDTNCADPSILAAGTGACPTTVEVCLAPGIYRVLLAPAVSNGFPCGAAGHYRLEVSCEPSSQLCCDNDAIATDANGNPIMPRDWDGNPVELIDIDQDRGNVSDLYPGLNTTLDLWYGQIPCDPTIGDDVDREDDAFDLKAELGKLGIVDDPDEILDDLTTWEQQATAIVQSQPDGLLGALSVVPGPFAVGGPHCPPPGNEYVFGGRDIILIHGLRLEHLTDRFYGVPGAEAEWRQPTVFPGSIQNPEFYAGGYFKTKAETNWSDYIQNFLQAHNIKNRYLVVCYPCTQRAEIGVHAVLTQIADAMRTGVGVVDPSGCDDTSNFGTPSFVVLSHSTGALVTDAAMHAAATYPNLGAGFIPQQCKAHVAPSGAFLGSHLATAAVGLSGFVPQSVLWDLCLIARLCLEAADPDPLMPGCSGTNDIKAMAIALVAKSVLIDLIPPVTQWRWGPSIAGTPVRTISAVAGHPSQTKPLKFWLHRGIDDGVVNINSQVPNPNPVTLGSSVFFPDSVGKVFDKGLKKTLDNPKRARFYYRDQTKDKALPPGAVASGATRWISPTGMLQPIDQVTLPLLDPEARYPNHFSFMQSASSHKSAIRALDTYPDYQHTADGDEHNWEETRVLTDPLVYSPYLAGQGDIAPLLKTTCMKPMHEEVRGNKIRFKIKIFGKKFQREFWIWRRTYHLLEDSRYWHQIEYIHHSVLCTPIDCTGPTCKPTPDFNGDGVVNAVDLATLLGFWGSRTSGDLNGDGIADAADLAMLLGAWSGG